MYTASSIFFVGMLIFLAHLFTGLFSRTRIPDVLLLMLIGLLIGPCFGLVTVESFGSIGPVLATITLVVLLFQGGLGLRLDVLWKSLRGSVSLTVVNFTVTMLAVGGLMMLIARLDATTALMLGAIIGGTSSAVVIPMVSRLNICKESQTILLLESALSDVLCIVVAITFMESYALGGINAGQALVKIITMFLVSAVVGIVAAFGWSMLLEWVHRVENSIFLTPAFVFVIYGVTEMLGYSGGIAALAFGITLGNEETFNALFNRLPVSIRPVSLNEIEKAFFSEAGFLLKVFFFVYIGISIVFANPIWMIIGAIATFVIFYIRVPAVWLSVPRSVPVSEASIMAIMVPKGLAAAVLASMPLEAGIAGGDMIQGIVYSVILFSILLCSVLVFLVDKTGLASFYEWMLSLGRPASPRLAEAIVIEAAAKPDR
jgi:cell volume regulation protein A